MRFTPGNPGEGSTVPDGEHPFEVTNAEEKVSNNSGNDMIELTLKIKDGPTVYDYLVNIEESAWKLTNFLASIDYEVKPGVPLDINPDDFVGKRGTCILYTDTWQGKKKNKVSDYMMGISVPVTAPQTAPQTVAGKNQWR